MAAAGLAVRGATLSGTLTCAAAPAVYRWVAIRGEPLAAYFTLEETAARDLEPFTCNMFLAEDRVLCFEIVGEERRILPLLCATLRKPACIAQRSAPPHLACAAKRHRMWLLRWVAGATAHTDTPQSLVALIKQRRRWLNGSLFALIYYLQHFPRILAANHSVPRKAALCLQWVFQLTTAAFAWTAGGLRGRPRARGPRCAHAMLPSPLLVVRDAVSNMFLTLLCVALCCVATEHARLI